MPFQFTAPAAREALNDMTATAATLTGATLHLYDASFAWTANAVLGDLSEASFTGYHAAGLLNWHPAYTPLSGIPELLADMVIFTCTGIASTALVYGYYITSTAAGLVGGEQFATPYPMTATAAAIPVVPRIPGSAVVP